jgi:hypothetical protein
MRKSYIFDDKNAHAVADKNNAAFSLHNPKISPVSKIPEA